MINPYPLPTVVSAQLIGVEPSKRLRIDPSHAIKLDLASMLPAGIERWAGTFTAWAANRVNLFFVSHSLEDPSVITTVEHSEVYRGGRTAQPLYDKVESRLRRMRRRSGAAAPRSEAHRKVPTRRG